MLVSQITVDNGGMYCNTEAQVHSPPDSVAQTSVRLGEPALNESRAAEHLNLAPLRSAQVWRDQADRAGNWGCTAHQ